MVILLPLSARLWVSNINCRRLMLIQSGQPSFIKYMELDTRPDANDLIATTNGLFQAGGTLGTLALPWFCDKFGRKWGVALVRVSPSVTT